MALVTPNQGQLELMAFMLIDTSFTGFEFYLDLYSNNYTPVQSSTASNFTIATFAGYSQQTFTRSSWATPTTVSNQAYSTPTGNPFTWTCTSGSQTIYGYLVRSSATGNVLWAELFSSPVNLSTGVVLQLNLQMTLFGENP
jgi:hypothetical protein